MKDIASTRRRSGTAMASTGLAFWVLAATGAQAGALPIPTSTWATSAGHAVQAGARSATDIASQPARDVGLLKADIPEALVQARKDPYGLGASPTCDQINSEIEQLSASLGPDVDLTRDNDENRLGELAMAGGKSVVNSIIPFRMVVREVSGAAPAQRRYQEAMNVGYARRGFLRGVSQMQNCRPAL